MAAHHRANASAGSRRRSDQAARSRLGAYTPKQDYTPWRPGKYTHDAQAFAGNMVEMVEELLEQFLQGRVRATEGALRWLRDQPGEFPLPLCAVMTACLRHHRLCKSRQVSGHVSLKLCYVSRS